MSALKVVLLSALLSLSVFAQQYSTPPLELLRREPASLVDGVESPEMDEDPSVMDSRAAISNAQTQVSSMQPAQIGASTVAAFKRQGESQQSPDQPGQADDQPTASSDSSGASNQQPLDSYQIQQLQRQRPDQSGAPDQGSSDQQSANSYSGDTSDQQSMDYNPGDASRPGFQQNDMQESQQLPQGLAGYSQNDIQESQQSPQGWEEQQQSPLSESQASQQLPEGLGETSDQSLGGGGGGGEGGVETSDQSPGGGPPMQRHGSHGGHGDRHMSHGIDTVPHTFPMQGTNEPEYENIDWDKMREWPYAGPYGGSGRRRRSSVAIAGMPKPYKPVYPQYPFDWGGTGSPPTASTMDTDMNMMMNFYSAPPSSPGGHGGGGGGGGHR